MTFPSSPVKSNIVSSLASGRDNVIGLEAEPLEGVALDDRCFGGFGIGCGCIGGGGNGMRPDGGNGNGGNGVGGDGDIALGTRWCGRVGGNGAMSDGNGVMPDAGDGGGAGGMDGDTGSNIDSSSICMSSLVARGSGGWLRLGVLESAGGAGGGNQVSMLQSIPSSAGCQGITETSKSSRIMSGFLCSSLSSAPCLNRRRYDVVCHCSNAWFFRGSTSM